LPAAFLLSLYVLIIDFRLLIDAIADIADITPRLSALILLILAAIDAIFRLD